MYIYTYVYICICVYIYIYVFSVKRICSICTGVYVCRYTDRWIQECIYMYKNWQAYPPTYLSTDKPTYLSTYTDTHFCIYIHIHLHHSALMLRHARKMQHLNSAARRPHVARASCRGGHRREKTESRKVLEEEGSCEGASNPHSLG